MTASLAACITAPEPLLRDRSLEELCAPLGAAQLLAECAALERLRRESANLYERVRALFFLAAIHRYHLPQRDAVALRGRIPAEAHRDLLERRFPEALERLSAVLERDGPSHPLCSALAAGYRELGFQTLADQVRRSVRSVPGNEWMFAPQGAAHPLRLHRELRGNGSRVLVERAPVRMDLSHSGWSDIFFLGMDYPEGARVLNASIDLGVHGRDAAPRPPVEVRVRALDRPVLRLESIDLDARVELTETAQVFDFARDYLGLLRAGVIAAGIVPPALEGTGRPLREWLGALVAPGGGLEIVTCVHGIPRGSRLAVSTTLLAALIAACMRATGQTRALTGPLEEPERRLVAARAILGEWLGGSGGGWQDSGGLWPGIKRIEGVRAAPGDPEFGVSRGCLLPRHTLLGQGEAPATLRQGLRDSLVLVHGGMAQNVGPILEMVTEKYLLRCRAEWQARQEARGIFADLLRAVREGDVREVARSTHRNFFGPLQAIIPWCTNHYTERLVDAVRTRFREDFRGFWMLGGMSGGGMGFFVAPARHAEAVEEMQPLMQRLKDELCEALPFAMDPVVYDFALNEQGSVAELGTGAAPRGLAEPRSGDPATDAAAPDLDALLREHGFDPEHHESIRRALRAGTIGLAASRLPPGTVVEDVRDGDVLRWPELGTRHEEHGRAALGRGAVASVCLAGGLGSRWTQGAGVVKALHPFCKMAGRHRSFLEIHRAKMRQAARAAGRPLPQVFTTSYLTHAPLARFLAAHPAAAHEAAVLLSPGRAVGLRLVPMERDLRFLWEELPQQILDEQAQKVRDSLRGALIAWAREQGEGSDYRDNVPLQCLHPVGHFYEVPNLLGNGVLQRLLREEPGLEVLLVHNVDTLGATVDPRILGAVLESEAALTFEVVPRWYGDEGGGLARVDGRLRLVEGLALPRPELAQELTCYSTMTCWVHVDRLLETFGLGRDDLAVADRVRAAVRRVADRLPTYVTLKEVKKRWGRGQEDVYPVAQFEKLWGDMTVLPEVRVRFLEVPRRRGQQLKDPAQLDGWSRDGSAAHVESLCDWN